MAIRLLQMTAAAGHFLQENRLYKAFRLLQRVRAALPEHDEDEDPQRQVGGGYSVPQCASRCVHMPPLAPRFA